MLEGGNPYGEIYEDTYRSCDYVGDFFTSPIVIRAFGDIWNQSCMPLEELDNPRDFDIINPQHLWFIRQVWQDEDYWRLFLQALRKRGIQLKNIWRFQYDYKQLTAFILLWRDIQFKIALTPESLSAMFRERASDVVLDNWADAAYSIWENVTTKFQWLNPLTSKHYSPIDERWNIVYGLEDGSEFYDFFKVINESWDVYYIDHNGKILDDDAFEEQKKLWIKKQVKLYDECIWLLQWEVPKIYTSGRILEEITSFWIPATADKTYNNKIAISKISEARLSLMWELKSLDKNTIGSHLRLVHSDK